jgi:HPt (histidine-containing phosphotransfer) domain-containing protein
MAERATVDLVHLARYTGGDRALNAEVFKLFDQQTAEMVVRLRSVLAARDAKGWKEITHTLKGAARGIGAFSMADACAAAEPLVADLSDPAAEGKLNTLEAEAKAVQGFIRDYLAA